MSYAPESSTDGRMHPMNFACSQIQEIGKNRHVFSHHDDFHMRLAPGVTINFLPEHPPFDISVLQSACFK
jgi:hypothetical protein